jgi:hypothetical protein
MMEMVEMQQFMMEMIPKPPRIQVAARIGAVLLVPPTSRSLREVDVYTSFGVYECWTSGPLHR